MIDIFDCRENYKVKYFATEKGIFVENGFLTFGIFKRKSISPIFLVAMVCVTLLTGCRNEEDRSLPLPPAVDRQRIARFDFNQGPIFVRLKDKHLVILTEGPLRNLIPEYYSSGDIVGIRYERSFRTNQLNIRFKLGRGPGNLVLPLHTPLPVVEGELTSLEKFLAPDTPHLKIVHSLDYQSAFGPLEVVAGCALLFVVFFLVGGDVAPVAAVVMIIPLLASFLYTRLDGELVSLALAFILQKQAGMIIDIALPLLLALLAVIWIYAQKQQELNPAQAKKARSTT